MKNINIMFYKPWKPQRWRALRSLRPLASSSGGERMERVWFLYSTSSSPTPTAYGIAQRKQAKITHTWQVLPVVPDVASFNSRGCFLPLRVAAAHRRSHQPDQNKTSKWTTQMELLTAVETGDISMSRSGLMELMFQGAPPVGSDVGTTGPNRSPESITGQAGWWKVTVCVRSGPAGGRVGGGAAYLRWSRSPRGQSSSPPRSLTCVVLGEQQRWRAGKEVLSVSRPISAPGILSVWHVCTDTTGLFFVCLVNFKESVEQFPLSCCLCIWFYVLSPHTTKIKRYSNSCNQNVYHTK